MKPNNQPQEALNAKTKTILALVFAATILFPLYVHLNNQNTPKLVTPISK